MKKVLLATLGFVSVSALAQGQQKMQVQPSPKPNVITHVTSTQELSFSVAPTPEIGRTEFLSKGVLKFTQTNKTYNPAGQIEANVAIDGFVLEQTIEGKTTSMNTSAAVGQSVTVVADRAGKLVDIRVPEALKNSAAALRQLIGIAYSAAAFLPEKQLAIGESTTADNTLPITLPGGSGAPIVAPTTVTLKAVNTTGGQRVAQLEQRVASTTDGAMTVSGSGTVSINLDRGFVAASATEWNVTGKVPQNGPGVPPGTTSPIRANVKVTVAATE